MKKNTISPWLVVALCLSGVRVLGAEETRPRRTLAGTADGDVSERYTGTEPTGAAFGPFGFGDSIEVENLTTPLDWEARGMEMGAPFASAHSFIQTGPFRPRNIWGENVVFTGSGTQPGVGMPMVLVSGRLAAERVLGPDPSYRSRAWR